EALQPARSLQHSPLFQVVLNVQNAPRETLELGALRLSVLPVRRGRAEHDLIVDVYEGEEIRGTVRYNTDILSESSVESLVRSWETVLERTLSGAESPISELVKGIEKRTVEVVVAATFTAEPLGEVLEHWLGQLGVRGRISF